MIIGRLINLFWWVKGSISTLIKPGMYKIRKGYNHRDVIPNFDDRSNKDEWQDEVYLKTKELLVQNNFDSIIDFGCGSGYKLIKYFDKFDTLGFELEPTLSFLKTEYKNKSWKSFDNSKNYTCDLLILSDVIEHIDNPTQLLLDILKCIDFKIILVSTPDRTLLKGNRSYGPPYNVCHYREWNFEEFADYINDFLTIQEHLITNEQQATQLIVGEKRRS